MQKVTVLGIYPASNRILVKLKGASYTPYVIGSFPEVLTDGKYEPLRAVVGDEATICWQWGHYFVTEEDALKFAKDAEIIALGGIIV